MKESLTSQPSSSYVSRWHWNIWRLFLFLACAQGGIAIGVFIITSIEAGAAFAFRLNAQRSISLILALTLAALFFLLFLETWVRKQKSKTRLEKVLILMQDASKSKLIFLLVGAAFFFCAFILSLTPEIEEPFTKGIFTRVKPFVIWFTGLSGQATLLLLFTFSKDRIARWNINNKPFKLSLLAIAIFMGIWAIIVHTSYARESQITGWYELGAPILDMQVLLAWVISILFAGVFCVLLTLPFGRLKRSIFTPRRMDLLIAFILWMVTAIVWWRTPFEPNWFVSEPRYPNYEYYPNSDARAYDTAAQTALIGEGYRFFKSDIVRRPLLEFFFSLLHLIGGQTYEKVIFFQVLVLALFPALVFLVTAQLHHRLSGLLASLLILFREMNSIRLGGLFTTSHAKLLMADLPSALVIALFFFCLIVWLKGIEQNQTLAMISGGVLGMAALIRAETLVFLFVVAIFLLWKLLPLKAYRLWAKHFLLFILGILLMLAPWIYRNWAKTGQIFLDSPTIFRLELIILRYRPAEKLQSVTESTPSLTEEGGVVGPSTPSVPATPTPQAGDLQGIVQREMKNVFTYIHENSVEILSFIVTHYANSQLQTMLILPTTFRGLDAMVSFGGHHSLPRFAEECCSPLNYMRRLPYWRKWDGRFLNQSILPFILNSVLLAWGINLVWKRNRTVALLPLACSSSYLLLNALFRNSGGRYILPVDWVMILYFSVGVMDLTVESMQAVIPRLKSIIAPLIEEGAADKAQSFGRSARLSLVALGCILFGAIIPTFELLIPPRYNAESAPRMLQALSESSVLNDEQQAQLISFLEHGGQMHAGRALYPRAYPANVGEPGTNNPFGPWPYPRLAFSLIGPFEEEFSLPITKKPPAFPHASDVLVFVCPEQRELLAVAIFDEEGHPLVYYTRSPWPETLHCPLPSMLFSSGG